jgi:A/G-specific adenine glycosylase
MSGKSREIGQALLEWFRESARRLPWRETRDPYAIWVSEIMLQQTRVEAVIPYYERFLARFPNVEALAAAPEEELLAAWSGLGYYSRARNLQKAARQVLERGGFPESYEEILELPGIGEYTAAAVASIAFGQPYAVLDGNVMRVMSRLSADFGDIAATATKARLREAAQRCLVSGAAGDTNQAFMELGATLCLPREPRCLLCPVAAFCKARAEGIQDQLPTKLRRAETVAVETTFLLVERNSHILLWQRPASDRMAGFWELPEPEMLPAAEMHEEHHRFRHSIMNHAYRCTVYRASLDEEAIADLPGGFDWLDAERLEKLPLSTMARKALRRR